MPACTRSSCELAGNGTLLRVWRSLEPMSRTYITMVGPGSDPQWSAALHDPILEAIENRDTEAVVRAIESHFDEVRERLAGNLAEVAEQQAQGATAPILTTLHGRPSAGPRGRYRWYHHPGRRGRASVRTIQHWIDGAGDETGRLRRGSARCSTRPRVSSRPRSCSPSRATSTGQWPRLPRPSRSGRRPR